MRIFVIGGTGFIGFHAVAELLARGHTVTVLSRRPEQAAALFGGRVEVVPGDIDALDSRGWAALLQGMDAVVFAAGIDERVKPEGSAEDFFYSRNVVPTRAVLEGADQAGVARVVVISSVFVWVHRQHPELELERRHPYIRSRILQQEVALSTCRRTVVSVLELPYVFGASPPGQKSLWEPIVNYARTPFMLMCCEGGSNMIAVGHVAEAIAGAVERPCESAVYTIGDRNFSWRELLLDLCDALGRRERRISPVSNPVMRDVTAVGAFMKNLFGMESGLDMSQLEALLTLEAWYDAAPSRQALGYGSGGLEQAIRDTVASCPERAASRRWRRFWDWMATGKH